MSQQTDKPKKRHNTILKYSGIGFQMGVTIYLGNLLGLWLDEKYPNDGNWYTKMVTLAAVFLSMAQIIIQATKDSKEADNDK